MGRDVKVMVVGDAAVGKTCLLISYTTNSFPSDYIPTVFDNYNANTIVDNQAINLSLWDTAGSDEFNQLRPLSYPGTDVFLICFSIFSPESFTNISKKWLPEIRATCPDAPILLVGLKSDLRDKPDAIESLRKSSLEPISISAAEQLVKDLRAYRYLECSSLTQVGMSDVFEEAVRCVINPQGAAVSKPQETVDKTSSKQKGDKPSKKDEPSTSKGKDKDKDCIIS